MRHHLAESKTGAISLSKGYHQIKLDFFECGGGSFMTAEYSGPDTGNAVGNSVRYPCNSKPTRVGGRRQFELLRRDCDWCLMVWKIYAEVDFIRALCPTPILMMQGRAHLLPARTPSCPYTGLQRAVMDVLHFKKSPSPSLPDPSMLGLYKGWMGRIFSTKGGQEDVPTHIGGVVLEEAKPDVSVVVKAIDYDDAGFKALGAPEDNFAAFFTGMLMVDVSGVYEFYTSSDDGSNLFVDNIKVVDNDGLHGTIKKGARMRLTKGLHFLKVTFFEAGHEASLKVTYSGPDTDDEESLVLAWLPPSAPNQPPPPPPLDSQGVEVATVPFESDAPDAATGTDGAPPPPPKEGPRMPGSSSSLNMECAKYRDGRETKHKKDQMKILAKCMNQVCVDMALGVASLCVYYGAFTDCTNRRIAHKAWNPPLVADGSHLPCAGYAIPTSGRRGAKRILTAQVWYWCAGVESSWPSLLVRLLLCGHACKACKASRGVSRVYTGRLKRVWIFVYFENRLRGSRRQGRLQVGTSTECAVHGG